MTTPDSDFCGKYERIIMELSSWIAEQTWDGHEKDCKSFAGGSGPCGCIKFWREEGHKMMRLREIEAIRKAWHEEPEAPPKMPCLLPRMMDLQAENARLWHENSKLMHELHDAGRPKMGNSKGRHWGEDPSGAPIW